MKKRLLLLILPLLISCQDGTTSIENPNTSSEDSTTSSSSWSENAISLQEAEALIEKAKTFKNIKDLSYYRKDNFRYEDIKYERYDNFYTLEGEADSYTDAWDDPSNVVGYFGFPSDGSINVFYDVLKSDVATQHAKLFSIKDNPASQLEFTEEDGIKKLDEYENNLSNFIEETYYLLKNDPSYTNEGSLRAERSIIDGIDTLHIVAEKDYDYLYQSYHAVYDINININNDGSFSKVYFKLDDAGTITINSIDLEYGEFHKVSELDTTIFNPELYFAKKLNINFQDIYTPEGKTNTLTVGSAAYLMPHFDYIKHSSDFTYLPATAVDYWDINVLSSSNEEVISYSEEDRCFVCNKPGKTTLTVGATYNPYCTTEVEVEVIYPTPSEILGHTPYNQPDYVGEAFTNCDVLLDVSVGPYSAVQDMIITSSDDEIAIAYIDVDGNIKVRGRKEGYVTITVASKEKPSVKKDFSFHVVGELKTDLFLGKWEDNEYYSTYGMKFAYEFKADGTGTLFLTAKDSTGTEQQYEIPIKYALNVKTQDISITPIGWTVQQDLLTVHYYTNSYLKTYFQYGEYYFSINLTRVSE